MTTYRSWILLGFLIAGVTGSPIAGALDAQVCAGRESRPWLGIGVFDCAGGACTVLGAAARAADADSVVLDGPFRYDFSVEPSLWEIDEDGPAAGKIEEGDVLVAVNDRAVTSNAASELLDGLSVRRAVRLLVRRDGRFREVSVTPERSCAPVWVAIGRRSAYRRYRLVMTRELEARDSAARAAYERQLEVYRRRGPGLLGVAIRCGRCELILGTDQGGSRFRFEDYPEVVRVTAGSLSDRAGLRPGDVLTHLDGLDLRTDAGADRLANLALRAGARLEIRYLRDGEPVTTQVGGTLR